MPNLRILIGHLQLPPLHLTLQTYALLQRIVGDFYISVPDMRLLLNVEAKDFPLLHETSLPVASRCRVSDHKDFVKMP